MQSQLQALQNSQQEVNRVRDQSEQAQAQARADFLSQQQRAHAAEQDDLRARAATEPQAALAQAQQNTANVEQQTIVLISQANAQAAAAQQALIDEQQKREMAAENERLKKGLAEQHDTFSKLVQDQQTETDKLRQFAVEYQSAVQNKHELNRDIAEAVKNAMIAEREAHAAAQAATAAAGSQQTVPSAYPSYTDFTRIDTPAFGSPVRPAAYDLTQNYSPQQVTGANVADSAFSPPPRVTDGTPKAIHCPGCGQMFSMESAYNYCLL